MRIEFAVAAVALVMIAVPAATAETYTVQGTFERGDPISDPGGIDGVYYDGWGFYASGGKIEFLIESNEFLPGLMIQDAAGNMIFKSLGSAVDRKFGYTWTPPAPGEYGFYVFQSYRLEGTYTFTITESE